MAKSKILEELLKEIKGVKIPDAPDFSPFVADVTLLKQRLAELAAKVSESIGNLDKEFSDVPKTFQAIKDDIRLLQQRLNSQSHGGNANRNIQVEGVNVLRPYTDINLVGTTSSILASTDNQNKVTIITVPTGGGGGTPSAPDTSVQFNDSGSFGGSAAMVYDKDSFILSLGESGTTNYGTLKFPSESDSYGGKIQLSEPGFSFTGINAAGGSDTSGTGVQIQSGRGDTTGSGGTFTFISGQGGNDGSGGAFNVTTGRGRGTGSGGALSFTAGIGGSTSGAGGSISLTAGSAQGGDSNGGNFSAVAGAKTGAGTAGALKFKDGASTQFAILDTSLLSSTDKTFSFPNTTGTLALTSDVVSNVGIATYAVGTAYTFTNSAAGLDFGTTDPIITLNAAGTYLIMGQVNLAYNGATVTTETATIKVRRTNNTAADLSAVVVLDLPVSTLLTNTYGIFQIPPFVYTTAVADDAVTLFGSVSAGLGAGSIDATAIGTSLVAVRLY